MTKSIETVGNLTCLLFLWHAFGTNLAFSEPAQRSTEAAKHAPSHRVVGWCPDRTFAILAPDLKLASRFVLEEWSVRTGKKTGVIARGPLADSDIRAELEERNCSLTTPVEVPAEHSMFFFLPSGQAIGLRDDSHPRKGRTSKQDKKDGRSHAFRVAVLGKKLSERRVTYSGKPSGLLPLSATYTISPDQSAIVITYNSRGGSLPPAVLTLAPPHNPDEGSPLVGLSVCCDDCMRFEESHVVMKEGRMPVRYTGSSLYTVELRLPTGTTKTKTYKYAASDKAVAMIVVEGENLGRGGACEVVPSIPKNWRRPR